MPQTTPLHPLHLQAGAKMVNFADYQMPISYAPGIVKEHLWTRQHCSIFDISHMGQAWLCADSQQQVAEQLEKLSPAELIGLAAGKQLYTVLLNQQGGITDDLIIAKPAEKIWSDRLFIVVNAARKEQDFAQIEQQLPQLRLERLEDRAQLAIQGPKAEEIMASILPVSRELNFMDFCRCPWQDGELLLARSGYTGEDGFEVSLPGSLAVAFAQALLSHPEVEWAGLGARDSLRLEAGLCLYGHDLDEQTSPIEAGLLWSIGKRRRTEGGFAGADLILEQIEKKNYRTRRVGFAIEGAAPCREGTPVLKDGVQIGSVSSGGFSPSLGKPIAMGYIENQFAKVGQELTLVVRGRSIAAEVCKMPFVAHRYRH